VTGLPIQPDAFDRKYIKYSGAQGADGSASGSLPVQVVQPQISFQQYSEEERNLLLNAISGIMSPATLGIDVAKKDNADAQREKEKVTIFTRKILLDEEQTVFEHVCSDLLVAYELMNLSKGEQLKCKEYTINVQYAAFANESFEKKLETVQTGWGGGLISDRMALDLLYGDSISKARKDEELKFLQEQRAKAEQITPAEDPNLQGGFGSLGAENAYNEQMEKARIDEAKEDLNIPDLM